MKRAPLGRRTPLRPKRRTAAEHERVYGTTAHQRFLRGLPCVGCGRMGSEDCPHHLHHVRNDGMGRKADAKHQVPLCCWCHQELHHMGQMTFERAHGAVLLYRTLESWAETFADAYTKRESTR